MEVENRLPVESQFIAGFDQKLDSRFVIQNHLGLGSIPLPSAAWPSSIRRFVSSSE